MNIGTEVLRDKTSFNDPFDVTNEQMVSEFLLGEMNRNLDQLKSESYYEEKIDQLGEIDSLKKCHLLNIYQL